jgi:hypothetical protein
MQASTYVAVQWWETLSVQLPCREEYRAVLAPVSLPPSTGMDAAQLMPTYMTTTTQAYANHTRHRYTPQESTVAAHVSDQHTGAQVWQSTEAASVEATVQLLSSDKTLWDEPGFLEVLPASSSAACKRQYKLKLTCLHTVQVKVAPVFTSSCQIK